MGHVRQLIADSTVWQKGYANCCLTNVEEGFSEGSSKAGR